MANHSDQRQPLLLPAENEHERVQPVSTIVFSTESPDIPPITGPRDFFREFWFESKKILYLAGPAIFTNICWYSLGGITQTFAGQLSALDLAAFSIENSLIAGFCFGFHMGMGSALETLCGQAYGAGKLEMLGIYLQRSWVILNTTSLILCLVYIFAKQILLLIRQEKDIAVVAGRFATWMIPQLFAYSMNFPILKYLQSQSKIMVMAIIAAATLVFHVVLSWLLMLKLRLGLVGAAVVLDVSWWLIVVTQMAYIVSGACGPAWTGFSFEAFRNIWAFVRLSLSSAVMLCLEVWYFMALILFAGYLKNAEVSVDGLSVCLNLVGWANMISFGMNAAVSVRVSNELGASHPRTARFSLVVAVLISILIGIVFALVLIICRNNFPAWFSSSEDVQKLVKQLTPMLAFCILINNIQPVLSGVAIGAGWQTVVAYVNIACYYILGVPLGLLLGFKFDLGVKGIWSGMLTGTVVQTLVLSLMIYFTNWNTEASLAEARIKRWGGGDKDSDVTQIEKSS